MEEPLDLTYKKISSKNGDNSEHEEMSHYYSEIDSDRETKEITISSPEFDTVLPKSTDACDREEKTIYLNNDVSTEDISTDENIFVEQEGVRVSVSEPGLWMNFNKIQTEMIINRGGRRMFPYLFIVLSGLKPDSLYDVMLEILPADSRRYKFFNQKWVAVGVAEPEHDNPAYLHPDSPSMGSAWMSRKISFARVKLTNSRESAPDNMFLHSMHKYVIQITVQQQSLTPSTPVKRLCFVLQETNFIAVTAYQNSKITQLKILNNPFAKAFRDGKPKYKRNGRRKNQEGNSSNNDKKNCNGKSEIKRTKHDIENPRELRKSQYTSDSSTLTDCSQPVESVTRETSENSMLNNVYIPQYNIMSAYQYSAGFYASLMAYHARMAEMQNRCSTLSDFSDGTSRSSHGTSETGPNGIE